MKRQVRSLIALSAGAVAAASWGQTPSELCADAPGIGPGVFLYSAPGANKDGVSTCGEGLSITDRWVNYAPAASGPATITLSGPCTTIVSVHSGCPGTAANTIVCNVGAINPAQVNFAATPGSVYSVRLVNVPACTGPWTVTLSGPPAAGGFTYQGRLKQNGSAAGAPADLRFSLWTLASGGTQVGGMDTHDNIPVSDGLFTVRLNDSLEFGTGAFGPDPRWLEVAVRSPAGSGTYTTLSPRQQVTPTPLAARAQAAFALAAPDGSPSAAVSVDDDGRVGIGTDAPSAPLHIASMAGLTIGQDAGGSTALHMYLTQATGGAAVIQGVQSAGSTWGNLLLNHLGGLVRVGGDAHHLTMDTQSSYNELNSIGAPLRLNWDTGQDLIMNATGRVGIGTLNPQEKVDVHGAAVFRDAGGYQKIRLVPGDGVESGRAFFRNSFEQTSVLITGVSGSPSHGAVGVGDSAGVVKAKMIVEAAGTGVVQADIKNFRVPNPLNTATDIVYACPEGPEAAMYIRGTAHLQNGRAVVTLPDHFRVLAVEHGMTVQLTARSGASRGLAAASVSLSGIVVEELLQGSGTYDFDWRVEAVRREHQDYRVIRDWREDAAATGETEPQRWAKRLADTQRRQQRIGAMEAALNGRR